MVKGIVAGLIAGLVGAAVWGVIAYYTNYEIGWVAWGIGALVGAVGAKAAGKEAGVPLGVACAVIAVLSIAAGKYGTIHALSNQAFASFANAPLTDELVQVGIAANLADEREAAGVTLNWPTGQDSASAHKPEHFPADIWSDTLAQWTAASEEERQSHRDAVATQQALFRSSMSTLRWQAFTSSFGMFDLLFVGLAVVSAFKLGTGGDDDEKPQPIRADGGMPPSAPENKA